MNIKQTVQTSLNALNASKIPDAAFDAIVKDVETDVEEYVEKRCKKISTADVIRAIRQAFDKPETGASKATARSQN